MRYVSKHNIAFSLKIPNSKANARISFVSLSSGGSSFSTTEAAIIEAMEKSPMFGKHYFRAPECVNEVVSKKKATKAAPKKKVTKVDSVEGWQEAVEYLVENFGCQQGKLVTPDEILKEAERNHIVFTKLV